MISRRLTLPVARFARAGHDLRDVAHGYDLALDLIGKNVELIVSR
jgi:hypothetical protein